MWHPADPAGRRWERLDGARVLLGLIAAHLIREEWWQRTGEWPGDEAPHGPAPNAPRRVSNAAITKEIA